MPTIGCGNARPRTRAHPGSQTVWSSHNRVEEQGRILEETLDETDGKVIIWANYLYNIHEIKNFLIDKYGPESTVSIYGEVSVEDRKVAVDRIQKDDKCRFLVGNPTTGGFGLTLTACNTVIYYMSLQFS